MRRALLCLILLLQIASVAIAEEKNDIKYVEAPLIDVIKNLADEASVNLIINDESPEKAHQKVTMKLSQTTPRKALIYTLQSYGVKFKQKNNTFIIALSSQDSESGYFNDNQYNLYLQYISAERAIKIIEKIFPNIRAEKGSRSSSLVIFASMKKQAQIKQLLQEIDQPMPKILIEAKVVEIAKSKLDKIGITFSNNQSGIKLNMDKQSGKIEPSNDFILQLNMLLSSGEARLLSEPRVAVLDGEEANINIGNKVPYAVPSTSSGGEILWAIQYIDAGVSFKITPHYLGCNLVELRLEPEVSAISEWKTTSAGEFPVISSRNVRTIVTIKEGTTLIIAGLQSKHEYFSQSNVPILSQIPIFGELFKYDLKESAETEIVFLITPSLIL